MQLDMDSYAFSPSPSPLLEPMLLTVSPPNSGGSSTTPPNGIEKRSNLSMAVNIGLLRADADEDEFGDVLSAALRRGRSTNQSAKSRSANRRRRWYLGIQSKKDPGHVMTEVLHALGSLAFSWILLSPFRIKGKWTPPQSANNGGRSGEIKVIFQLYKVQSGIYLLDFQKVLR